MSSSWLGKILPSVGRSSTKKTEVPEGLWKKCAKCGAFLYRPELEKNQDVCPKCDHHMRINARRRLDLFLDAEGREELAAELEPVDRLKFKDSKRYKDRLASAQKGTGEKDALVAFRGTVQGYPVVAVAFEFEFLGGSMGTIVGEKFVRAANAAIEHSCPLVCFSASGGARMKWRVATPGCRAPPGAQSGIRLQGGFSVLQVKFGYNNVRCLVWSINAVVCSVESTECSGADIFERTSLRGVTVSVRRRYGRR